MVFNLSLFVLRCSPNLSENLSVARRCSKGILFCTSVTVVGPGEGRRAPQRDCNMEDFLSDKQLMPSPSSSCFLQLYHAVLCLPQFLPVFHCSLRLSHALSNSPPAPPAFSRSLLFLQLHPKHPHALTCFVLLLPASSFLLPLLPPAVQPVSILFLSEAQGANTPLLDARGNSASFLLCCAHDVVVRCCLAVDSDAYVVASVFRIRLCVSSLPAPKTNRTYA
jgi:hypothetical protein